MNFSEQPVYLGVTRYKRTVWNSRRRRDDQALLGTVRFGKEVYTVVFIGNPDDIGINGGVAGGRGYWKIAYTPDAKEATA